MTIMTPTIPKAALRALTELTGEPRADVALLIALKDAVEHRLEIIEEAMREFEQKYRMTFEQFQARGEEGKISNQFSYEIESDYLEWDGLISRKKNLEKIGQWLIQIHLNLPVPFRIIVTDPILSSLTIPAFWITRS